MTIPDLNTPSRKAAVNGLAVVGFAALVGVGMWLALYSARYVPGVFSRVGAAAVSLGSIFVPAPSPALSVVPTATSTVITFGGASTTATSTASSSAASAKTAAVPSPVPGSKTTSDYPIGGGAAALSGLPDLVTTITHVGYLTSTSTDSFVTSASVPAQAVAAVQFTIKNIGTNATGPWSFSASIPTSSAYIFQSPPQQSLNPGESIDYTLGFDQALKGSGRMISVTANYDHKVVESNPNNDSASATITVLGS